MDKIPLASELKLELYPRKTHEAVFDRIDLVLNFQCGENGTGAVVKSFVDAILLHDEIVKQAEEKMTLIDSLKRVSDKKSRLFRNLDSAWNIMLDNPVDFYEYSELLPKMKNVEYRLTQITDSRIRAEVLNERRRFQELHPVCSKQLIIHQTYLEARSERDNATKDLCVAENELQQIKDRERQAALRISDDHIAADELGQSLSAIFPNVHGVFVFLCAFSCECLTPLLPQWGSS